MIETGFLSSKILFAHRWRLISDRLENIVRSPEASNKCPARKFSALSYGRADFYKAIHDKQEQKYGRCLTIVLGEFDGKEAVFLFQNMFPVRDCYLDHIHTRNNNPVLVKHSIHKEVSTNMKRLRQLHARGKKVVFPDINRLEQIMLSEMQSQDTE